jgi:hypothetical protein
MKRCDGRDQPSVAFLPKLGPLELKRPFFHPRLPSAAPSRVSAPCTALGRPSLHQIDREREHDGGAAFARDTLFPVEPLEPGNLLRMDVPNILDVAIHGPADLDAVGIDEDELGKEAVVLGRQAFAQTLEKDCAFAIRARLRLDMPKLLSIASAQHRAATT